MNSKQHKTRKFLKIPRISGGKEELRKFLKENLRYPKEASEKRIEGDVIVKYKIKDTGEILDPEIVKPLGYGCDEEALRLVKMLMYNPVKNRGVRVTASQKLKIPFRLSKVKIQQPVKVIYTPKKEVQKKDLAKGQDKNPEKTNSYTITIRL